MCPEKSATRQIGVLIENGVALLRRRAEGWLVRLPVYRFAAALRYVLDKVRIRAG